MPETNATPTTAMTVQVDRAISAELDALAATTDRSRDDIVNDALQTYLALNTWQIARITAGMQAAREGRVRPAEQVFADIAARHGLKL